MSTEAGPPRVKALPEPTKNPAPIEPPMACQTLAGNVEQR
jgi:hypothetical protein